MLRTEQQYLDSLRDGRVICVGGRKVEDVATDPAFAGSARTVAALYRAKTEAADADLFSFEENGERFSTWFLRPTSEADLDRRYAAHKATADLTCGMFGRSPDHVAGYLVGFSMYADLFNKPERRYGDHILNYFDYVKKNDLYVTYAILPPQAARAPEFYANRNLPVPTLQVVDEDETGVYISGMKMLATGAAVADEIWIGNLLPIAAGQEAQSITCAIPCNAKGLSLWSRQTLSDKAANQFDAPLTWAYDESDAMLLCERVHVPWERVFVHNDIELSRNIYLQSPAHCFGNHQSNVRFLSKLQMLVGLAMCVTRSTGASEIPAVKDQLGWLAAQEAQITGMIMGQLKLRETHHPDGFTAPNRRIMYATLEWCRNGYSPIIDLIRELSGGGVFQMPASVDVLENPELAAMFAKYWETPQMSALERMKLFRLVWDLVGSEFAGRHQQYEKFYAGATFVVRQHSYREADWAGLTGIIERFMGSYDVPEPALKVAAE